MGSYFWQEGASDLILLERDFESKKYGYSANSYIAFLEEAIPTLWEPGLIFMQDNAAIHTAKKVKKWFQGQAILVLEWPPYSLDLNPIEHLWFPLKQGVEEVYPNIENISGGDEKVREELGEALRQAWPRIPQEHRDTCLNSMLKRIEAVIKAEGWYTKY